MARVTSYLLLDLYELLFITEVTSCFLHTSYGLLFIPRVTCYLLTMSYNKDEDDKAVYNNKVMIKNYFLGSLFIKNLGSLSLVFLLLACTAANAKTYFLHYDNYLCHSSRLCLRQHLFTSKNVCMETSVCNYFITTNAMTLSKAILESF